MTDKLAKKKAVVQEIATRLSESKSTIVTDYKGLNVAQVTELRKQLREAGIEYKVLKNTLTRLATTQTDLSELNEHLIGPTAIAFSNEDVVAPAKILYNFAKENEQLEIKAGVVEGKVVSLDEIKSIASLPSREGLISMLLSVLQGPVRNLALTLQSVADQKQEQEQA
ncbi:LSU ribosomal protein L10P [Seinonella peptonophila]|uniref:Large ribosomal subunit protein uL10 n=1 Tax=Seinonella peptonophila TaxID=112248 RepID=A0A1M4YUR6_9BACL|nr:50S ribosomal protein L10 [Seinonella peptonophila]SHF09510.1 LSU ribosomal protein L10P [Seinonella peptonophila]